MPNLVLLSGSPSAVSRSTALLTYARQRLEEAGLATQLFELRDFPPEDLILARYDSAAFTELKRAIGESAAVVLASPIYKASFTGGLKTVLDVLPQAGLRGKTVLPLATGGSAAHQLAIDYAFKPVLSALGATDLHQGVYVVDSQLTVRADGELVFNDEDLRVRLENALDRLVQQLKALAAV